MAKQDIVLSNTLMLILVFAIAYRICSAPSSSYSTYAIVNQTVQLKNNATTSIPTVDIRPQHNLTNATYCFLNDTNFTMDLYFPNTVMKGGYPMVIYVHGGAWTSGDKSAVPLQFFFMTLLKNGYAVSSINYGLFGRYPFPDNIDDIKCAVRFLRANAYDYSINPKKMAAIGASAGGHLVALLGATNDSLWDIGPYKNQSARVEAVIDLYGPTNLTQPGNAQAPAGLFGGNLTRASPSFYVSASSSPFLLMQGDQDNLVAVNQSLSFYNELRRYGVPAQVVIVKNGIHGLIDPSLKNYLNTISPNETQLNQTIITFLNTYLNNTNS